MTQLRDRNVLVTGAASGIGLLLAQRMAERGARTILWDVDAVALESARARVAAAGGAVAAYVCDLSDRESIASTAARVVARHGRVDVLVNNAGIVSGKRLLDLSDAEIERTFAVNTLAPFRTVRAFLPGMLAAGDGHVVTIASAAGIAAAPRLADYSASKAAVTVRRGKAWVMGGLLPSDAESSEARNQARNLLDLRNLVFDGLGNAVVARRSDPGLTPQTAWRQLQGSAVPGMA